MNMNITYSRHCRNATDASLTVDGLDTIHVVRPGHRFYNTHYKINVLANGPRIFFSLYVYDA